MKATSKIDIVNNYREPRKIDVPMSDKERKEYRRIHPKSTEEDFFKVENQPYYYCKAGEEINIVSENPGAWKIIVTAENKSHERFAVRWDELNVKL